MEEVLKSVYRTIQYCPHFRLCKDIFPFIPSNFSSFLWARVLRHKQKKGGNGESLEKLPRRFAKKRGKRRKENRGTLVTSCASMKSLSIFFSFSRGG